MKIQEAERVDATLLKIESAINELSCIDIGSLNSVSISTTCSKILAFSERLNNLAYRNLYLLEAANDATPSYLSLLNGVTSKEGR